MSGKNVNVNRVSATNRIIGNHSTDIEMILREDICEYARGLLMDDVFLEYESQLGEWKKYINRVIDAEAAQKNFEDTINAVLNEKQKSDQLTAMFAMMALSLVAGPALSWITGSIETKVFPKYFSIRKTEPQITFLEHRMSKKVQSYNMYRTEIEYNQVAAKVFGEFAANVVQKGSIEPLNYLLSKMPERNVGESPTYQQLTVMAMNTPNNDNNENVSRSLRTLLDNTLIEETKRMKNQIAKLAWSIKHSEQFGAKVLSVLYNRQPRLINALYNEKLRAAKAIVRQIIDEYRQKWAQGWLYYGNNPPQTPTDEMSRKIEREIWAMWILDQKFEVYTVQKGSFAGEVDSTYDDYIVEGRSKISFHNLMIERLIELSVVAPQTLRQMYALNERNLKLTEKEHPTVDIDAKVDSVRELESIQNWAKNHKHEFLSGRLDHTPRRLSPISDIYK